MELELKKTERGAYFNATGKEIEFICFKCGKSIKEGYQCENNEKITLCPKCQIIFPMSRCKHDVRNEHRHIKFTRANGNQT